MFHNWKVLSDETTTSYRSFGESGGGSDGIGACRVISSSPVLQANLSQVTSRNIWWLSLRHLGHTTFLNVLRSDFTILKRTLSHLL